MSFNVTQLSSPLLQSSKASMVNISKANSSFLTSSGISSSSRPKKHLTCFVTVTPKRLTDTNGSIENSAKKENQIGIGLTIASTTNGYVAWSRVTSRRSATHTSLHDIECRKGKKCCKENFHVRMKTKVKVVILRKYL